MATQSGKTDNNGNRWFKLLHAPGGLYEVNVGGLTHRTLTWNSSLDVDNPDTFTR